MEGLRNTQNARKKAVRASHSVGVSCGLAAWSEFPFVPCVDSLIRAAREIRGSTQEFPTTDLTDFHG